VNFPTTIEDWEQWKKQPSNWEDRAEWRKWMEENGYDVDDGETKG
jgi:hypothetical protein